MSSAVERPNFSTPSSEAEYRVYETVYTIDKQAIASDSSVSTRLRFTPQPIDRNYPLTINFEDIARKSMDIDSNIEITQEIAEPTRRVHVCFTDEAEKFIRSQKKSTYLFGQLNMICKGIEQYMHDKALQSNVIVDLFHDPEYPDWVEPSIRVRVKAKRFSEIYRIYDDLFDAVFQRVPKRVMKKTSLVLEKI